MTRGVTPTAERASSPENRPRIRLPVAMIVKRLPRRDQTHFLREIDELERQGQPIVLVPLLNDSEIPSDECSDWFRRCLVMPLFSGAIGGALLRALLRQPLRLATIVLTIAGAHAFTPRSLFRTMAIVPKAVYLASELQRIGVGHVHAHAARAAATAAWIIRLLGGPAYSFTVHGPDVFVRRRMLRNKIAGAAFVRTVSSFNEAFLLGLYPDVAANKIVVVPTGVDPDTYVSTAPPRSARPTVILTVSSLLPHKGFEFLLEAIAILVRAGVALEWRIAGDGPLLPELQALIEHHRLGAAVKLLGLLPRDEVVRHMRQCDIFVLPGTISPDGQMDSIPVALIEAMAAGRPVVAPAISGIPEVVADRESGVLVDATQPVRIAEAVKRLTEEPTLRERMGRAGRDRVKSDFDLRATGRALMDLFEEHEGDRPEAAGRLAALDLPELSGTTIAVHALHERNDSIVAEVTVGELAGGRDLVIKQHRSRRGESRPAPQRAVHEREVLRRLRRALREQDLRFSVPEVVAFDERQSVVVMTRALGRSLDSVIREQRSFRGAGEELHHALRRAGGWLAAMHRATATGADGRHDLAAAVVRALRDFDLAAAASPRLASRRSRLFERVRELEAVAAASPLPVTGHHGDYWPGNIFVDDQRVEVIDFEGYRDGLGVEDIAWFLVHLELPFMLPPWRHDFPRLARSFLAGYASAGLPVAADALRLLTAAKALHLLARGEAAQRGNWRRWWLRRTLLSRISESLA